MRFRFAKAYFELLLGVVAVFALCAPLMAQKVKYNYMRETNFSKYHTYKWVSIGNKTSSDHSLEQQIRDTIDAQLAAKHFVKTDDYNADLYVGYQVATDHEKQWQSYGMGSDGDWAAVAANTSPPIKIGTLGIDIYDRAKKQLVWRGWVTKALNPPNAPNTTKLLDAAKKLFKYFPPWASMNG